MERFLLKKKIVKSLFHAKILLLLFALFCMSSAVMISEIALDKNPLYATYNDAFDE